MRCGAKVPTVEDFDVGDGRCGRVQAQPDDVFAVAFQLNHPRTGRTERRGQEVGARRTTGARATKRQVLDRLGKRIVRIGLDLSPRGVADRCVCAGQHLFCPGVDRMGSGFVMALEPLTRQPV
jgi:hypothetical protein